MATVYYAPGHRAMAELLHRYPMAGLDIIGLTIEISDRGDTIQREEAKNFMEASQWTKKEDGKEIVFNDYHRS